jgi:hypothetical protein
VLLNGSVIEDKLPDEGAIRHSSVTLQQRYHLFQHLVKRHTSDPASILCGGASRLAALPSRPTEAA